MVVALRQAGFTVVATDITDGCDFLTTNPPRPFQAIITNPPYELATEFIERAVSIIPADGFVAMLLRTDFDHAKSRQHLFGECASFWKKVVLTKRVKWFEDSDGQPPFNHAWMIWWAAHSGKPTLAYGP
jgi:hypothetical protein